MLRAVERRMGRLCLGPVYEVFAAVRDERPWVPGAHGEGPVAAEDDPVLPEVLPECGASEADDGRVVGEAVDVEAAHGLARGFGQVGDPGAVAQ